MEEKTSSIKDFIASRPELSEERKITLHYLDSVSDKSWVIERTKGRSSIKCEFDCGAYKGSEIYEIRVSNLSPIRVANALQNLTSGHYFSYPEADNILLSIFKQRRPND